MENHKSTSEGISSEVKHIPVLLSEVMTLLDPKEGESYLDLTAGYGGHAEKILERTLNKPSTTLVDRDQNATEHLLKRETFHGCQIIRKDFLSASNELLEQGRQFDIILADLGVSSPHLDNAKRGFSIKSNGPLDMRMDDNQVLTADTIVNNYSEEELVTLLREYGEEHKARSIARKIVNHRPISTTHELAKIIAHAWPGPASAKRRSIHPATKSFQALRIAVNDELGLLEAAMPKWLNLLAPDGRIAIISFHSLEDRLVKNYFAENSGDRYDAPLRLINKKPITASHNELVFNPRARSAKLRAAAKINTKGRRS